MKLLQLIRLMLISMLIFLITISTFSIPPQKAHAENAAVEFSDIAGHWGYATIMWAASLGIVKGAGDGTFGPNRNVTEAEFLAMLFNAYPNQQLPALAKGPWYAKYYEYALSTMHWPVSLEAATKPVIRGQVARIIAASQGKLLSTDQSVQFLLDQKLANGKTSATVAGFGKQSPLTRAEAVSFVKNLLDKAVILSPADESSIIPEDKPPISDAMRNDVELAIRGIAVGDAESDVLLKLGQPDRKDLSEYGFQWYIYNKDYTNYVQVGVQQGKVVGLYSNSSAWKSKHEIKVGSTLAETERQYGSSLTDIQKGNTIYSIPRKAGELDVFLLDNAYTTLFYDTHVNNTVTAVQQIAKSVELALKGYSGKPSKELSQSFERQDLDLVNAVRVRMGLKAFQWAEDAANSARKHSEDMKANDYFEHDNLQGDSPFDRMEAEGIKFGSASENIAAGQQSAIFAHEGWMNSTGHRTNILANYQKLGVGVAFGGTMGMYYTENFYTPLKQDRKN